MSFLNRRYPHDPQAFAELFERTKNLVYKTAFLMLGSTEEAEDALQEVFVLVYQSLASFDPRKGALTTWMHRITVNYCLGVQRKRQVDSRSLEEDELEKLGDPRPHGMGQLEDSQVITQAIQSLSEKQRAVVILRYYWDMPYNEIAEILEVPLGTVKSRLDRALRSLRNILANPEDGSELCPAANEEAGQ